MAYRLKDWTFLPASQELRREGEWIRLEHRAAATLALLCERRKEIISQREIIDHVWKGRLVSANTIPVVIADLRRALGDEARRPTFIETISKSGYRLIADDTPAAGVVVKQSPRARFMTPWLMTATVAGTAIIGGGAILALTAHHVPIVLVEDIRNQTGDGRYDPLADASSALFIGDLSRQSGIEIARDSGASANIQLRLRMTMWNGSPGIDAEALNLRTRKVIWAKTMYGPSATMPDIVHAMSRDFAAAIGPRRVGGPR